VATRVTGANQLGALWSDIKIYNLRMEVRTVTIHAEECRLQSQVFVRCVGGDVGVDVNKKYILL